MPMTKLPTFSTFPTQQGDLLPKSLRSRTPALLWMCLLFRHCLQPQRRLEEEESQDTLASEPFLLIFFSPIFLARLGEAHVWFLLNERVLMKPLPRYWKIRVFFLRNWSLGPSWELISKTSALQARDWEFDSQCCPHMLSTIMWLWQPQPEVDKLCN